jgi:hypothetical protein
LHIRFAKDRLHGEWFNPSKALLAFIDAEASSHLQERLVSQAKLQLEATAVPVLEACRQGVSASSFDCVFANDGNLMDSLIDYCDWDQGEEWDGEGDPEDYELVSNSISSMAIVCDYAGSFIEGVGVNADAGKTGFICGPCNSGRRMEILRDLGHLALDVDAITPRWFFFAIFWDCGQQIGIDLLRLAFAGGKDNSHIFDPSTTLRSSL